MDGEDFGVRVYGREYLLKLMPVKLRDYGIGIPWITVQRPIRDLNNLLTSTGYRIIWIMDEENQRKVSGAFLLSRGLDVPVEAYLDEENDLHWRGSQERVMRIVSAASMLKTIGDTQQVSSVAMPTVEGFVSRLYEENIMFACFSPETVVIMEKFFDDQDEDRTDIKIRIRC